MIPICFFVGPTASGKSHWALHIAEENQIPIINGDSVQVYKHLDVGTAKPNKEERQRTPHFLFDFIDPPMVYTAGKYFSDSRKIVKEQSGPVFFVGGSGFYLQAFEKGMYDAPEVNNEVHEMIATKKIEGGDEALWLWLEQLDAEYARSIHRNDHYRVKRALEIVLSTKKTMAQVQKLFAQKQSDSRWPEDIQKVGFWPEKNWLIDRVTQRCEKMIANGLVEEVQSLQKRWPKWSPLQSVGYAETLSYLAGKLDSQEHKEEIIKNTMQLAKRQKTWFKRDKSIHWVDPAQSEKQLMVSLKEYIFEKKESR